MTSGNIEGHEISGGHEIRLRRPIEDDYAGIAMTVDDWWDGKVVQGLLPRLWFRHFAGTSWIADRVDERGNLRIAGFLVGFVSQDIPDVGVIQAVGVDPNHRRSGIGTALVERYLEDAREAGMGTVETVIWPANRRGMLFLAALAFLTDPDVDARPIYGVQAIAGYDFGTEDRARFTRRP